MSTSKKMNVQRLLGYKLKKTQHALRLHMDEAMRELGLTTPQYAVLAQLELENGLSSAELARRSFITAQTMQGIVSNLTARALVEKRQDPKHGRILSIFLTKEGLKTVKKAHDLIDSIEEKMTATMSGKRRGLLEELLSECLKNLNNNEEYKQ